MREENIEKMNFKQLRYEVQLLRDEIAILRRKFDDAIYNLDSDNFGKSFTLEQNGMKAQIKVNAQEISTKITAEDLGGALVNYSTISQTADQIQTAVIGVNNTTDEKLKNYSTVEQTAAQITSTVTSEFVTDLIGDEVVTNAVLTATISQSANEIKQYVSAEYQTKEAAEDEYDLLYSEISQTAGGITSRVSDLESFKTSVFTQTKDGFTLDGEQTTFTGVIWLTDNSGVKRFSLSHDESQGFEQVIMDCVSSGVPIVIGDEDSVYIGYYAEENTVATRDWVRSNVGDTVTAVFG